MIKKIFLTLFLLFALAGGFLFYEVYTFMFTAPSEDGASIYFEVKPGPFYKITNSLKEQGLISNRRYFTALAKVQNQITKVKTGEYELRKNMLPTEILSTLVSGKMVQHEFTVQEGLNIYEIAALLEDKNLVNKDEFLRLAKNRAFIKELLGEDLPSLEGYLFPDTYRVTKYEGARNIIKTMVAHFHEVYKEVLKGRSLKGFTRHEAVILASMIEKETGATFERPVISSVFQNRLRKRMRLQSDPTILYGIMEEDGVWKKNIRKKDIQRKTAYNTYRVNGLPKGPIANPGRGSLLAVLEPESTDFLYFVSRNDGTHYFSKTYKEHQKAVRDYQLNRKARQGKSWRDLKQ
jgi:UPF0755 protein